MRVDLRYQISLFGDFENIAPKSDIVNPILEKLKSYNLVPGSFIETQFTPNGINNSQRLSLRSNDMSFSIEFKLDRIDFYLLNTNINVFNMISIDSFAKQVKDIFYKLSCDYNLKVRRIGFVRYLLFIEGVDHSVVYNKLNKNIKYYENLPMKDWSNYLPASISLSSGIAANAVTTIKHFTNELKINSTIKTCDGVMVVTDVNTSEECKELRFDSQQTECIIDELQKIEYKLCSQFTSLINEANE